LPACCASAAQKAAALDPGGAAAAPGPGGDAARARREEACYAHVAAVLRVLWDPAAPAPPPLEPFHSSLDAAERERLRREALRCVAASGDRLLQESAYAALLDLG
jgi:hypothetical protein